jgi:hypothetical protein
VAKLWCRNFGSALFMRYDNRPDMSYFASDLGIMHDAPIFVLAT